MKLTRSQPIDFVRPDGTILQGILARTKPHTINQDGTVTLLPDPTPTPSPTPQP